MRQVSGLQYPLKRGPVATPETPYYMPDLPEWLLRNGQASNQWLTFRAGASVIFDYTPARKVRNL
jgi:hypothetical protein